MKKHILLVDDSSVMRKMVTRSIRQTGLDVDVVAEAGNGKEALDLLDSQPIDLVFCDWNMPVMDGLQFLVEARKKHALPIVMLTTEGTSDRTQEALKAGANGYLTKPFTPEGLQQQIKSLLGL
ncbi:MAG: response regulator [Planctomycetes bacterium]|nr:response regulator [Planctomycetota bacterium]